MARVGPVLPQPTDQRGVPAGRAPSGLPAICYKKREVSRKYRQKGYMDDGPRERRPRSRGPGGPTGPPERREGPRGRGLGAPTETLFKCARCGAPRELGEGLAFDASCKKCGDDLHTCTNCLHFDTSARFECRQEIPERIAGKAKGNECELFEPKTVRGFASEKEGARDAKSAFDALFDF